MCKLGCSLISSPTGLSIEFEQPCMVQVAPGVPGYAYMWHCVEEQSETVKHFLSEKKKTGGRAFRVGTN